MDIKNKNIKQLQELSEDLRQKIIQTVSQNGGHLSPNIGAVELIVAMHYVFDATKDPFIFDVSHQSYAHKLLTDRWEKFDTLRTFGGISGYTKPTESKFDYFIAGHSSTSISLAVGAAKSIALKQGNRVPVALIGDGSMSAGMVYEALNELGDRKYPVVIVLNDNEMSIAKPIGAISKFLSQHMAGGFYQKFKGKVENILSHLPDSATYMAKKFEESFKLITPGIVFEELGIEYIGPINGHDLESLIETFKMAQELKKPVIVHTQTLKGKGYEIAEGYHEKWHGVGPFDIESGKFNKKSSKKAATKIYSDALLELAKKSDKIVGVTAAMPSGTGMDALLDAFPNRFWDVAIAEQHAVTSMCAMAKEGFKPFVAIYSTFLQRAYDQIIHDACILNLPIAFAIDRAGIVGEDGETHQGVFDISYLRAIPNMTLFAPRDEASLIDAVKFASTYNAPCAFRYPRGAFILDDDAYEVEPFELAKAQLLRAGTSQKLFIGYGNGVGKAHEVITLLQEDITLVDLRFVKPLDRVMLQELASKYSQWFVFSDSAYSGGVATALMEYLHSNHITDIAITSFEYDDNFIEHGDLGSVEDALEISAKAIAQKLRS
jgi:1-deoxy-D-xylulose-5-phosphate synthase